MLRLTFHQVNKCLRRNMHIHTQFSLCLLSRGGGMSACDFPLRAKSRRFGLKKFPLALLPFLSLRTFISQSEAAMWQMCDVVPLLAQCMCHSHITWHEFNHIFYVAIESGASGACVCVSFIKHADCCHHRRACRMGQRVEKQSNPEHLTRLTQFFIRLQFAGTAAARAASEMNGEFVVT